MVDDIKGDKLLDIYLWGLDGTIKLYQLKDNKIIEQDKKLVLDVESWHKNMYRPKSFKISNDSSNSWLSDHVFRPAGDDSCSWDFEVSIDSNRYYQYCGN